MAFAIPANTEHHRRLIAGNTKKPANYLETLPSLAYLPPATLPNRYRIRPVSTDRTDSQTSSRQSTATDNTAQLADPHPVAGGMPWRRAQ